MNILAPSILSADFAHLAESAKKAQAGGAGLFHIDVMDGHFVPNISFGATVMKSLLGNVEIPFDVHLMIEDADRYMESFVTENTEYITVHREACTHLDRSLQLIKSYGVKSGVAINPATPIWTLDCVLDKVDLILVMSVNPGFGGQKMIYSTLEKVRQLKKIKEEKGYNFKIELDGGVNTENVKEVVDAGVEIVVAGSAVFDADDITERVKNFVSRM